MADIHYFTDGSVMQHHQQIQEWGSFGYVQYSTDYDIVDCAVGYSIPDIHYLECLAIRLVLQKISATKNTTDSFIIFTDSSDTYSKIKNYIVEGDKKNLKSKTDYHNRLIVETANMFKYMIDTLDYDIHLFCIKSHTNPILQKRYMAEYGIEVNRYEARFICKGSNLVDMLVSNTARFHKAYPNLQYIK